MNHEFGINLGRIDYIGFACGVHKAIAIAQLNDVDVFVQYKGLFIKLNGDTTVGDDVDESPSTWNFYEEEGVVDLKGEHIE